MPTDERVLTEAQREQFLTRGHVVLHDCFPREVAQEMTAQAFVRLGYDPDDPATWEKSRIHMPTANRYPLQEFAPKAWQAACELLGGAERLKQPVNIGDGFIINFRDGQDKPWQPPSAQSPGWHKDGDWFLHFLDSPEQGLLTLILWSDIEPQGGGTFVACDSVGPVARFLAAHPEGVAYAEGYTRFDFVPMLAECHDFIECTGRAGDIVLLHPFMLHASSQNLSGTPRFLTNPCFSLQEPMNFNRANPDDFSLVEQAALRGLGVERLDFQPAVSRERIVPERERIQARMLEEEKARLAALSGATRP
ncbi:MAG TPA: phytanoyl-CoA dioxygenase family protein [Chthonomonadaceae bacterium]|nr:phytanoyl-CoA dioxygenase family protein [Chthonomonadaceae bacterium]